MPPAAICRRGAVIRARLVLGLLLAAAALVLVAVVEPLVSQAGLASVDPGLVVLSGLLLGLALWARRSFWLLRNLSALTSGGHQLRSRSVWLVLVAAALLVIGLKLGSADVNSYKKLVFGEGGVVEWTQVLLLALSARLAWLIGVDLRQQRAPAALRWIVRGLTVALVFLLLEELAWGQVIFSWQTPDALMELNAQEETTLHNIWWFQERLDLAYFLVTAAIAAVVGLAPQLQQGLRALWPSVPTDTLKALIPPRYLWPLFSLVAALAFCVATNVVPNWIVNRDQEWGELLLYGGVLIALLRSWVLLGPKQLQQLQSRTTTPVAVSASGG